MTIREFRDDDEGYLAWVHAHPEGFVVNLDKALVVATYPMVHRATHRLISSPARTGYTTGDYLKYCGLDLGALEQFVKHRHDRPLTRCKVCM